MPRVMIINPVSTGAYDELSLDAWKAVASASFEAEAFHLDRGPVSVESEYDIALAAPGVVRLAERAEEMGFHGVVIHCFLEPGWAAAREAARVPVVGLGQAACLTAQAIAERYGIVGVLPQDVYLTWHQTARYNGGKLAAVRPLGIPVTEMADEERTAARVIEVAGLLVREDRCDAVVLGCGAMPGVKREIETRFGCPVVEPGPAAAALVQALIAQGLAQSKLSAPSPAAKERS